jgi:hypothetical protein
MGASATTCPSPMTSIHPIAPPPFSTNARRCAPCVRAHCPPSAPSCLALLLCLPSVCGTWQGRHPLTFAFYPACLLGNAPPSCPRSGLPFGPSPFPILSARAELHCPCVCTPTKHFPTILCRSSRPVLWGLPCAAGPRASTSPRQTTGPPCRLSRSAGIHQPPHPAHPCR